MTHPFVRVNAFVKGLVGGLFLIQVFDVGIHAATNQIEPLRIASNLMISAWIALILLGTTVGKRILVAAGFVFTYIGLNCLFLLREGVTNPNRGGELRVVLFGLVGVTVALSVVLATLLRQKRLVTSRAAPDGPRER